MTLVVFVKEFGRDLAFPECEACGDEGYVLEPLQITPPAGVKVDRTTIQVKRPCPDCPEGPRWDAWRQRHDFYACPFRPVIERIDPESPQGNALIVGWRLICGPGEIPAEAPAGRTELKVIDGGAIDTSGIGREMP